MKKSEGYAHGKIILIGEHAVVYGQPSIALPFPATQIRATITPSEMNNLTIECMFYKGLLNDMPELLDSLKKVIEVSLKRLNQPNAFLHIKIESTIPAERGMGSSAAVSVATTRALFDYYKQKLSREELLDIVNIAEIIAHGNPSGLDALMTSSSQPYYFIKNQTPELIQPNLDAVLIVADTGVTGQTKKVVQQIATKLNQTDGSHYQEMMTTIGELVKKSRLALTHNQAEELGALLTNTHSLLSQLGATSPELEQLVTCALASGALGAKLTGGGGGGCMIALAKNTTEAKHIAQNLTQIGAKSTWLYEMSDLS
ncbi:mevalonate kinase [Vagococcus intermedius]|uniref:Mevalonate kinase n=1 Tax=Vagococcus intermedius TaxID=2991418 RepID=A0AAF0CTD9_9ENTE|nr:mevalonate kinase [Vagococcus intermedius]WEG72654.1 mevalonate kinase [Vagococcus intermedius]WEG74739.1 mevalonate kinase [Vagococcus intermedius]